jgi:hypothetical protein
MTKFAAPRNMDPGLCQYRSESEFYRRSYSIFHVLQHVPDVAFKQVNAKETILSTQTPRMDPEPL